MIPTVQHKNTQRPTSKLSWSWLSMIRDRLGVAAILLFLGGLICLLLPVGAAVNSIGGILFGTGLTVWLSTWSNRQQTAKDANLRRKTDVYGPLHAELQNLRECLNAEPNRYRPFLQWIDVSGQKSPFLSLLNQTEQPPQFHCWQEFKTDYRNLDFSEPVRQMLNTVLQESIEYNRAVNDALTFSEAIFAAAIDAAITDTANSAAFHQWNEAHPSGLVSSSSSWSSHDWLVRIQLALATPPAGMTWASSWLRSGSMGFYRPSTLGWLLAENVEQAVDCIVTVCNTPTGSYPSPPHEWLQTIVEKAWLKLRDHPTFNTVRERHKELLQQVSLVEAKILEKLRYIQDTYEGGPPPL